MNEPFYGWDPKSERREELAASSVDLITPLRGLFSAPEEVDPRGWLHVENQGQVGSCRGHAGSTVSEICNYYANDSTEQLSRAFFYYATQKIDGLLGRDQGSTIAGGVELAEKYGTPPESKWQYSGTYSPNPPGGWDAQYGFAAPYKTKTHTQIRSYDDAFTFLGAKAGGLEIGFNWNGYCTPDSSGYIKTYRPGRGGSGHAVAIVGYSKELDADGRNYLWLANSWGIQWGLGGYAKVSNAAFSGMLEDQWTVCNGRSGMAIEQLKQFVLGKNHFYPVASV